MNLQAAIFAAVLIAIIVESMKLLKEDPQDSTATILLHISAQLANNTTPAYESIPFTAPSYAVVVNALFFASLCFNLIAALAGVIALQWVNEYDARLVASNPQKRALTRHFRYLGVERWQMGGFISMLPLLIHTSVFLFFAGIIQWTKYLHLLVFYICIGGVTITFAFYVITAYLAVFFGDAPFRSPVSRGLHFLTFVPIIRMIQLIRKTARWISFQTLDSLKYGISKLKERLASMVITSRLEATMVQQPSLEFQLVRWVAEHIQITDQSLSRCMCILHHAYPLCAATNNFHGPWQAFATQASEALIQKFATGDISKDDKNSLCTIANFSVEFPYKNRSWSMDMIQAQPWQHWQPVLRLIGPLEPNGPLSGFEMEHVMKMVEFNTSQGSDLSSWGFDNILFFWKSLAEISARVSRTISEAACA